MDPFIIARNVSWHDTVWSVSKGDPADVAVDPKQAAKNARGAEIVIRRTGAAGQAAEYRLTRSGP